MNKFKRGQKIICKNSLWQGQIGRVIDYEDGLVKCAFGEFEVGLEEELLELFENEFIKVK